MGLLKEFREFALRGNVVDMAVGIIIGGAFGGIVKSLIEDIVMPIAGILFRADFTNLYIGLSPAVREAAVAKTLSLAEARAIGPVLAFGNFITIVINFMILAFVIFMLVKVMNTAKRQFEEEQKAAPPKTPEDVLLLREIRDALRQS